MSCFKQVLCSGCEESIKSVEPNVEKSNIHIAFSGYVGTCRDGPVSCGFDAAFEHGDRGGQFEALCGGDTGADADRKGMITQEMLDAYGCDQLVLTKTSQKALDENGEELDVWVFSFESSKREE